MQPDIFFPNIGIVLENVPQTLQRIQPFGIDIYWYAICIVSGMLLGLLVVILEAKRTGQNPNDYIDGFFYGAIFCIIGARLYYVIFEWDYYSEHLREIFSLRQGGLAIYGGIIAGIIFSIFWANRKKINLWIFADTAIIGLPLGQAIGRWGNFFNREAYGGYTDSFFAMCIKVDEAKGATEEVLSQSIEAYGTTYIQVHPTFLYESVLCFCLFLFLWFYRKRKHFNGELIAIYSIVYGIGRYFIEGLRTDQLTFTSYEIPISQVVSIIFIVVGITLYVRYFLSKGKEKKKLASNKK